MTWRPFISSTEDSAARLADCELRCRQSHMAPARRTLFIRTRRITSRPEQQIRPRDRRLRRVIRRPERKGTTRLSKERSEPVGLKQYEAYEPELVSLFAWRCGEPIGDDEFLRKGGDLTVEKSVFLERISHIPREPNPVLVEHAKQRAESVQNRIADQITAFAGSMVFVYIHVVWFACWIGFGVEKYPYGLLTMIVSLEAIFLSTFVMISQNSADAKRQIVADQQWQTV
jgi:hypothetical protein